MNPAAVTSAPEDTWAPGPLQPSLAAGAVHVWRADLNAVPVDLAELLSSAERSRAARILNGHHSELWQRSRGLLRALLGRYLQVEPPSLRFHTGEHGKPALQDAAAGSPPGAMSPERLSFNLSHSGQWALYAFSRSGPVGVDVEVEVAQRPMDEVAIANRMLGADVANRLQGLTPASRRHEFLRAWVRHEATMKCLGVGIGGPAQVAAGDAHALWVAEIELGMSDAAAAVAAAHAAGELRCWAVPLSGL